MEKINNSKEITVETKRYSYEDICSQELYTIPACDTYIDNEDGTFTYVGEDTAEMETLMESAVQLKIVGVVARGKLQALKVEKPLEYAQMALDSTIQDYCDSIDRSLATNQTYSFSNTKSIILI